MHAGRFLLAASVLLTDFVLAQPSGEPHLKREDGDGFFSPADIVKRQIPATGEPVVAPPAECEQACQGYVDLGKACGGGKEASTLSDEELLDCACQPDFLAALKSCTACSPQIFEGSDGSNAQTAIDDVAEQCTINDRPVAGFESVSNDDEYECEPEDGTGIDNGGIVVPGDAGTSAIGSDTAGDTAASTGSTEPSASDTPAGDGSSSSSDSTSPTSTDDSTASSGPTATPIADEDDSYDNNDSSATATTSSSASDDFGDFGGASSSFDSRHVSAIGLGMVTFVFACFF